jgi:hypothetical protein
MLIGSSYILQWEYETRGRCGRSRLSPPPALTRRTPQEPIQLYEMLAPDSVAAVMGPALVLITCPR